MIVPACPRCCQFPAHVDSTQRVGAPLRSFVLFSLLCFHIIHLYLFIYSAFHLSFFLFEFFVLLLIPLFLFSFFPDLPLLVSHSFPYCGFFFTFTYPCVLLSPFISSFFSPSVLFLIVLIAVFWAFQFRFLVYIFLCLCLFHISFRWFLCFVCPFKLFECVMAPICLQRSCILMWFILLLIVYFVTHTSALTFVL
jgi:hypothetical protein